MVCSSDAEKIVKYIYCTHFVPFEVSGPFIFTTIWKAKTTINKEEVKGIRYQRENLMSSDEKEPGTKQGFYLVMQPHKKWVLLCTRLS